MGECKSLLLQILNRLKAKDHQSNADAYSGPPFSSEHAPEAALLVKTLSMVVLSQNGKLLGIQPINRAAVNRWATNPLAKVLYGGQKLCPGLLEPRLKFLGPPENAVLIELLLSGNPASPFAVARPCRI